MSHLTTTSKIPNFARKTIASQLEKWMAMLVEGNLHQFEQELSQTLTRVYDVVCEELLPNASQEAMEELILQGKARGGRKIEMRPFSIRIATGRQIEVQSPYVKQPKTGWCGSRHLLPGHWGIIGGASPGLYDKVGFCCALGPSYDLAYETLRKFGVNICPSSVRELTNRLADYCFD